MAHGHAQSTQRRCWVRPGRTGPQGSRTSGHSHRDTLDRERKSPIYRRVCIFGVISFACTTPNTRMLWAHTHLARRPAAPREVQDRQDAPGQLAVAQILRDRALHQPARRPRPRGMPLARHALPRCHARHRERRPGATRAPRPAARGMACAATQQASGAVAAAPWLGLGLGLGLGWG